MPIIKSAIKQMRKSAVRRARNQEVKSRMKSMIKLILGYIQKGEADKANKILSDVIKSIDMAAKKNILHSKNAGHKKSRVQKAFNSLVAKK